MRVIVRELISFAVIFVLLSLLVHFKAWIDHPVEHIKNLSNSSLGLWHPLVLSLVVYVLVAVIRAMSYFIKKYTNRL